MNKIFYLPFLVSFIYAETSVFGAGDLNSATPYGLTSTEKVIVKNKENLKENEKRIKKVDSQLNDLFERVEALQSLIDGDGKRLNELKLNLNKIDKAFLSYQESKKVEEQQSKESLAKTISSINSVVENLQFQIDTNKENIKLLKDSIDKVVKKVNVINKNYVSRDEFKREFDNLIKILDSKLKKDSKKSTTENNSSNSKDDLSKSDRELMKDVREYFKKDYFSKALPILEHLIKKNYRPAECNYYMGEINYYRKSYKDALHYFKTSMMLYDKASYLPKLLLHSAISFESLGDQTNAMNFYKTIVDVYPKSDEAKEASKKIK